jgi:hypothetical protein
LLEVPVEIKDGGDRLLASLAGPSHNLFFGCNDKDNDDDDDDGIALNMFY